MNKYPVLLLINLIDSICIAIQILPGNIVRFDILKSEYEEIMIATEETESDIRGSPASAVRKKEQRTDRGQ